MSKTKLISFLLVAILIITAIGTASVAKTKVSLWTAYGTNSEIYEKFAEEYEASHPDVDIAIEVFPARAMEKKLATNLPTGQAGCILEEHPFGMAPYVKAGLISEPPDWAGEFLEESVYDLFKPGVYIDDELWGVPSFVGLKYLYWNKEMFEEAGLPGPPRTMDELVEYARKLVKYDDKGNITRSGISLRLSGGGYGVAEKWWMLAFAPYGGKPLIETAPGKYCGGFDSEATQEAVKLYVDLLYKYKVDSFAAVHDIEAFAKGKAAMFQRESFVIDHLAEHAPDLEYGIAPIPGDDYHGTLAVLINFWVPNSCKHKDIAWDFIKFISNKENTAEKFLETGWNVVRSDADYTPVYEEMPKYEPLMNFPEDYGTYFYPTITPWNEIWTKAGEWLTRMFEKESLVDNPEEIAKQCESFNDRVNKILKENDLYAPKEE